MPERAVRAGRPATPGRYSGGVQRWTDLSQIPADQRRAVVTLGKFDGVHRGHRAVLGELVGRATAAGAPGVVVTFDPHPARILFPDRAPEPIASLDHRLDLLADAGVDAVLVMEFTPELAAWTPQRFVEDVFVEALHARGVVIGADTRFGAGNRGDVDTLRELGVRHDFDVVVIEDQGSDPGAAETGGSARWSSSKVRRHLAAGDVRAASTALGRPHRVSGLVVHGDHRGRELGYPTANLQQDADGLVPADGVYAGWLVRPALGHDHPDATLPAAVSVGTNPTFDGTQRRVEAYVLGRTDLDLYGDEVAVEFVERLRPTLRFDSVEELLEQMAADVARCREVLATLVPPA